MLPIKIELSPTILIILVVVILIVVIVRAAKNEQELKIYKQIEKQQREIYYRNRNFEAKRSDFYLMTDKQKLEYTYENLPEKERKKVLTYAESLKRAIDNQKYNDK